MRRFTQTWLGAALIGSTLFLGGCKREVPSNIVDSTMRKVFLTNLPFTSSAMCGQKVTGVSLSTVTVTAKRENLTGTAHVKGTATGPKGPLTCEGDVDFAYTTSTSSKKKGIGKKKKTTTTTTYWLSNVKLKAVQTPGVTFTPPPDEKPPEDDADELAQRSLASTKPCRSSVRLCRAEWRWRSGRLMSRARRWTRVQLRLRAWGPHGREPTGQTFEPALRRDHR